MKDQPWWIAVVLLVCFAPNIISAWRGESTNSTVQRVKAGGTGYEASFIEHWVSRLLYYDAPAWVFTAAYTLFGLAVVAAWWRFPPRRSR